MFSNPKSIKRIKQKYVLLQYLIALHCISESFSDALTIVVYSFYCVSKVNKYKFIGY